MRPRLPGRGGRGRSGDRGRPGRGGRGRGRGRSGASPARGGGPRAAPRARSARHGPGADPAAAVRGRAAQLRRGPLPQRPVRVHVVHLPAALPALGARLQLARRGSAAAARPGGRRAVHAARGLRGRPRRRPLRPLRPAQGLAPGRHGVRPALLPLHLQPVPGLRAGHARVGGAALLRAVHRGLPVRLGGHADRAPEPHPRAGDQRRRESGAHGAQVRLHRGGQHRRLRRRLAPAAPAGRRTAGARAWRRRGGPGRAGVPEPLAAGGGRGRRVLAAVPRGHAGAAPARAAGARGAQPPAGRPAARRAALDALAPRAGLLPGRSAVHEHQADREPVADLHGHVPHLLPAPAQEVHRDHPPAHVPERLLLLLPHEANQQVHRQEPDLLPGPAGHPGLRRLGGAGRRDGGGRVRGGGAAGRRLRHHPGHLAGHDRRPHRAVHAQRSLRVRRHELLGQGGQRAGRHGRAEPAPLPLRALLQGLRGLLPLGDGGRDRRRGRSGHPVSVQPPGLAHPPAEPGARRAPVTRPSPGTAHRVHARLQALSRGWGAAGSPGAAQGANKELRARARGPGLAPVCLGPSPPPGGGELARPLPPPPPPSRGCVAAGEAGRLARGSGPLSEGGR